MAKSSWRLPPLDLLEHSTDEIDEINAREHVPIIERTLAHFGVEAQVRDIRTGPRFTKVALKPGPNTPIAKILRLEQDLAVALSGALVEIEPPNPSYSFVSLVVENQRWSPVKLRRLLESPTFSQKQAALKIGLGIDAFGCPVMLTSQQCRICSLVEPAARGKVWGCTVSSPV